MTKPDPAQTRREAVRDLKRGTIFDAAKRVFVEQGIEGATIRLIAKEAGYTPGAIYTYYQSKEEIYGDIVRESLLRVRDAVEEAGKGPDPRHCFANAITAFHDFYDANPQDLELSLYLYGGIAPKGLTPELNHELNLLLLDTLGVIRRQVIRMQPEMEESSLDELIGVILSGAMGTLIMHRTGRLRTIRTTSSIVINRQIELVLQSLK